MHIKDKIITLVNQDSFDEVYSFITESPCTITLWGSRSIRRDGYSGTVSLYWLVETLSTVKGPSFENVKCWHEIKNYLIKQYKITSYLLEYQTDIAAWIINYIREFNFYEFRSSNQDDFTAFVSISLDTKKFKDRLMKLTMVEDFWKGCQDREKKYWINRCRKPSKLYSSLTHRKPQ